MTVRCQDCGTEADPGGCCPNCGEMVPFPEDRDLLWDVP